MKEHILIICLLIVFFANAYIDKPTKSKVVWLLFGIVITFFCALDALSWWQNLQNPYWMDLEPIVRQEITELQQNNFNTSLIQSIVGGVIIFVSGWKILKRNPNKSSEST